MVILRFDCEGGVGGNMNTETPRRRERDKFVCFPALERRCHACGAAAFFAPRLCVSVFKFLRGNEV
jgi:hypothetical protein